MKDTNPCAGGEVPVGSTLAAALDYAARGWQVFPLHSWEGSRCTCPKGASCSSPAKHPRTRHGLRDATTDRDTITKWWTKWPSANVGIATGAESGVVVVDVDPRHGGNESFRTLRGQLGELPAGPVVKTGGGGWHIYFAYPGSMRGRIGAAAGIDFKADGGYVVAPPSTHQSGQSYSWHRSAEYADPPALPPAWLSWLSGRDVTESTETTDDNRDNSGSRKITEAVSLTATSGARSELASDVAEAIRTTLPAGPGRRNRHVFELARALKAIPRYADAAGDDLENIVRCWHREAIENELIGTEPFEETWIDFLKGWPKVKYPKGSDPMTAIFERARIAPLPNVALRYESPGIRLLVALCRELQRTAGTEPFFLSCRTAGTLLDCDHVSAWRWLGLLVHNGVLAEIEKGDRARHRATRYRYQGD